ncbi:MAG: RNA 2'-phosphotransferase [Ruminococcaceae bacterium]|nr:RNA 2'-phosphotransferase [Oscillospiraceae bacterium]
MTLKAYSKYLSYILRHHPEAIGITLDDHGWASVEEIVKGIACDREFSMEMLETIVATDEKHRYRFNEDKSLIRAEYGHSVSIDTQHQPVEPPEHLFHGTAGISIPYIEAEGIKPMQRTYVHMSESYLAARVIGGRHGKPIVYRVRSGDMYRDGYSFRQVTGGMWQAEYIPPEYIERIDRK